jgi:hypothetical protein
MLNGGVAYNLSVHLECAGFTATKRVALESGTTRSGSELAQGNPTNCIRYRYFLILSEKSNRWDFSR